MALEVTTYVVCDGCGTCDREIYQQDEVARPAMARHANHAKGWVSRRKTGRIEDLCPACAK